MTFLLLFPAALSALLLGAHFLRFGNYGFVLLSLAIIPLLFVHRTWAARLAQAALLLGTGVWVLTTAQLAQVRMVMGEPYLRMVIILGAVAGFTLVSALLFQTRRLRRHFSPTSPL